METTCPVCSSNSFKQTGKGEVGLCFLGCQISQQPAKYMSWMEQQRWAKMRKVGGIQQSRWRFPKTYLQSKDNNDKHSLHQEEEGRGQSIEICRDNTCSISQCLHLSMYQTDKRFNQPLDWIGVWVWPSSAPFVGLYFVYMLCCNIAPQSEWKCISMRREHWKTVCWMQIFYLTYHSH